MKVIFEFPPQSPSDVPDQVASPAPVTSIKSTFVRDATSAVIVRLVPRLAVELDINRRFDDALTPAAVKVPLTVIFDDICSRTYPSVGAIVRLAYVPPPDKEILIAPTISTSL